MNSDSSARRGSVTPPAAIGVVISSVILLALLAAWLLDAWDGHRAERTRHAAALTGAIARHVATVLTSVEGDLRAIGDEIRDDPSLLRQGNERMAARLRSLKLWSVSIGAINVFDARGVFVGTSVPGAELGATMDSPRLDAYRRQPSFASTVSPPIESRLLDARVFSLTIGVYDRDGAFLAMVGALVPTAQFLELFRSLQPAPQTAVLLLRADGDELLRQVHRDTAIEAHLDEPALRTALARAAGSGRGVRDAAIDPHLLLIADPIEPFDLAAVTLIDLAALGAAWLERMSATLLVFVLLTALVLGLNAAIVARMLRRERSLDWLHRREEQRFRDGIEAMADAFVLWDRDDRLVLWNARYCEMFPLARPHLRVGAAYGEVLRAATRAEWPDWDERRLAAHLAERLAMRGRPERIVIGMADGRSIATTERRTAEGGVVCLFQDVSDERRVAAALEASNALFRDGIEAMHDGFVLLDREERVVAWNQSFIRIAPHMVAIMRPGIAIAESMRFSLEQAARRHPGFDVEAELRRRLDAYRHGETVEMISASTGRQIVTTARRTSAGGMLLIYRDLTEIRIAEARIQDTLARLQAALDAERATSAQHRRFVSMASHEFRTPLAIIDSATQRLAATIGTDAGAAKRLARIRSAVGRMAEIIDRTLSSTRLDDGGIAPRLARFDLVQLVRAAAGRQQSISPEFTVSVACDPGGIEIVADRIMIEQVVVNLLSNAIKYSGTSRRVDVALSAACGSAEIAVRDYGVGVAEDEVGMLFTRYFRAATAMGIPGTGIGLHLVRELVTLHGGEVRATSALGEGSTFTVRLPLVAAETAAAAA